LSTRGLDVYGVCARVTLVTEEVDGIVYWVVLFRKDEKPYTYLRTEAEMVEIVKRNLGRGKPSPYRMWVIDRDENGDAVMKKVTIE
jgi:hypothetical protein